MERMYLLLLCFASLPNVWATCSETYTESTGTITSPGYPYNYHDNLNCIYTISGSNEYQKLILKVSKLNLEVCDNCECDWISLNGGPRRCDSTTFTKSYDFTDRFTIEFQTDGSGTETGFLIEYSRALFGCTDGRFGLHCDRVCHCKGTTCDPESGFCKHGCERGWKGTFCDKEKLKATAKFYCLKINDANTVIFRVNQRETIYRSVTAIDKRGTHVQHCDKAVFAHFEEGGVATLNVSQVDGKYRPRCGEDKDSDSAVSWRFKFQEFSLTSSAYDILFEFTCDFTSSENLERTTLSNSEKPPNKTTTLGESKLSISFDIIDPFDEIPVTTAKLGQYVLLQAKLNNIEDFGITAISPFSCSVSSLDNEYVVPLSDEYGCSVEGAQIYFLTTNVTRWRSELFETFTFPGHDKISFRCQFHICFKENYNFCRDMCRHSKKRKVSKHRRRGKGRKPTAAGTTLSVEGSTTDTPSQGMFHHFG